MLKQTHFSQLEILTRLEVPILKKPLLITGDDENTGSKGKKSDRTFKIINIKIKVDE